jgi:hypothetical protein
MARNAKRSEGLHRAGKAGEKGGKRRVGSLSPRPPVRARAGSKRKSAQFKAKSAAAYRAAANSGAAVESLLSPQGIRTPAAMVSRIARVSSGYVVTATFYGADYVRHEVEASAPTFAGVLAELASAVSGALGVAS